MKTDLSLGDRICGMVHGRNPSDVANRAFAEYTRTRPELWLRVLQGLPMEKTQGVGFLTNVMVLQDPSALDLAASAESPAERPFTVLITARAQQARLPSSFCDYPGWRRPSRSAAREIDLVRPRDAVGDVVDYLRRDVADEIKTRTGGGRLKHAYDCIADPASVAHCYAALGRTGGRYVCVARCV